MRLIHHKPLYILVGCPFSEREKPWRYGLRFDGDGSKTGYAGSWYTKTRWQAAKLWEHAEGDLRERLRPKASREWGPHAGEPIRKGRKSYD